jgi:hypothetical protein
MLEKLTQRIRERRRAPRVAGRGIRVSLKGQRVDLVDVSASGIRVSGLARPTVGQRFDGRMSIAGTESGKFVAEVVWVQDGACGLRFLEIAPALFLCLHGHLPGGAHG